MDVEELKDYIRKEKKGFTKDTLSGYQISCIKSNFKRHLPVLFQKWRKRPFEGNLKFNEDSLIDYELDIGILLAKLNNSEKNLEPIDKCISKLLYQGPIYRVLRGKEKNGVIILPEIDYHGYIASWTKSPLLPGIVRDMPKDEKCIVLEGNTNDSFGIDMNKYYRYVNQRNLYFEAGEEIIFPMERKYVLKEHITTLNEFLGRKK